MIKTIKIFGMLSFTKTGNLSQPIIFGCINSSAFNICTFHQLCVTSERLRIVDKVSVNNQELLSAAKASINLRSIRLNSSTSDQKVSGNDAVIVNHDPEGERFYIEIPGVGTANIAYERRDQLMIFKHTSVPSELGGRGLGKILAKEALEYVAKHDLQLEIQCSFIRKFVSKYEPKYIKYIKK